MLSEITEINNYLAFHYNQKFTSSLHRISCRTSSHKFYETTEELLTDVVIQKVCHFILHHCIPTDKGDDLILHNKGLFNRYYVRRSVFLSAKELSFEIEYVSRFRGVIQSAKTPKEIYEIPKKAHQLLEDRTLCLNDQIDFLYQIVEACGKADVAKLDYDENFLKIFSEGANFIAYHFLQTLYSYTPFNHGNVQNLFNIIGPAVTVLDCTHFFDSFNDIIPYLEQSFPYNREVFPNVQKIVLNQLHMGPKEKYNPLKFLGELIAYRKRSDKSHLGLIVKAEVDSKTQDFITQFFPASEFRPKEGSTSQIITMVKQKLHQKFAGGHHHSSGSTFALCASEQLPFIGPGIIAIKNLPVDDAGSLLAEGASLAAEVAESVLRLLEIFHISGLHHILEEVHEILEVGLTVLPGISTAILFSSYIKHTIHLNHLMELKEEIDKLSTATHKGSRKITTKAIETYLGKECFPSVKSIKQVILKETRNLDPRLYQFALEAYSEAHANSLIKEWKSDGVYEINESLFKSVESQYSNEQFAKLIEKINKNIEKRIAVETAQLLKTTAVLGLSLSQLGFPLNPVAALTTLTANVVGSSVLAYNEHKLIEKDFHV